MSKFHSTLFSLPIHCDTQENYSQKNKTKVIRKIKKFDEDSATPFAQLSHKEKEQVKCRERWCSPSWRFNDIVGYLDIGINIGNDLTAVIYLKRKCRPHSGIRRRNSTLVNNEFVHFCELRRFPIRERDSNKAYCQALEKILDETKKILKNNNLKYIIYTPPYDFSCFNFVKAHKQTKMLMVRKNV